MHLQQQQQQNSIMKFSNQKLQRYGFSLLLRELISGEFERFFLIESMKGQNVFPEVPAEPSSSKQRKKREVESNKQPRID